LNKCGLLVLYCKTVDFDRFLIYFKNRVHQSGQWLRQKVRLFTFRMPADINQNPIMIITE